MAAAKKTGGKKTAGSKENSGEKREQASWLRKYATAEDLQAAVDKYFAYCEETGELVGEEGLAFHLGVSVRTLAAWYDGEKCPDLQEVTELAYTKLQYYMSIDPRYQEKAMVSRFVFAKKQKRLGGWQDRVEAKQDISVNVKMGDGMEASDFA